MTEPPTDRAVRVLWLTPDKPASISVGRARLGDHLESMGFTVELRGTTATTVARSLRERGRYDVVVGTTRLGAIAGVLVSTVHGIPLVVDHIDPIRQLYETAPWPVAAAVDRLERLAFRFADRVLYVYDEEEDRIAARTEALEQTALGVDVDRFADPPADVVAAAREDIGDPPGQIAVYIGGLEPIYNVEALLSSAEHLPDWTLLVIGTGSLESEVSAAAGASDNVRYLGSVPHDQVPGYLQLADVGISLVDDPHTLKVLEYGAAGLPVVQLAGRAAARFGDRVVYCEAEPAAIAAAIRRAADRDGTALREFVRAFDWARLAETYAHAITTVKYGSPEG